MNRKEFIGDLSALFLGGTLIGTNKQNLVEDKNHKSTNSQNTIIEEYLNDYKHLSNQFQRIVICIDESYKKRNHKFTISHQKLRDTIENFYNNFYQHSEYWLKSEIEDIVHEVKHQLNDVFNILWRDLLIFYLMSFSFENKTEKAIKFYNTIEPDSLLFASKKYSHIGILYTYRHSMMNMRLSDVYKVFGDFLVKKKDDKNAIRIYESILSVSSHYPVKRKLENLHNGRNFKRVFRKPPTHIIHMPSSYLQERQIFNTN